MTFNRKTDINLLYGMQLRPLRSSSQVGSRIIPLVPLWLVGLGCILTFLVSACDSEKELSPPSSEQSTQMPAGAERSEETSVPSQASSTASADLPRIVTFGDSLTAGLGVPPNRSYPTQLQQRLDQGGYRYRVINAGVSGDTTAGGLRRLPWILKSHPEIVILELGANDGLRGHPLEETAANLEKIIQGLQEAGVTVVLAGMKLPPNYGLPYSVQFSRMYETLARKYEVTFIPFFLEGVAAQRDLNQADGIHPTGEGYSLIVENIFQHLEPLLRKKSRLSSLYFSQTNKRD